MLIIKKIRLISIKLTKILIVINLIKEVNLNLYNKMKIYNSKILKKIND